MVLGRSKGAKGLVFSVFRFALTASVQAVGVWRLARLSPVAINSFQSGSWV